MWHYLSTHSHFLFFFNVSTPAGGPHSPCTQARVHTHTQSDPKTFRGSVVSEILVAVPALACSLGDKMKGIPAHYKAPTRYGCVVFRLHSLMWAGST